MRLDSQNFSSFATKVSATLAWEKNLQTATLIPFMRQTFASSPGCVIHQKPGLAIVLHQSIGILGATG
jgi:hypothetical protein